MAHTDEMSTGFREPRLEIFRLGYRRAGDRDWQRGAGYPLLREAERHLDFLIRHDLAAGVKPGTSWRLTRELGGKEVATLAHITAVDGGGVALSADR